MRVADICKELGYKTQKEAAAAIGYTPAGLRGLAARNENLLRILLSNGKFKEELKNEM